MTNPGNEFWAAIAGAIVGGLISLAAQLLAFREARRLRGVDRRDAQQARGLSLLFKLMEITSNLDALANYVGEAFALTLPDGSKPEPWSALLPLANLPERVRFSTDEIALLLSLKNDPLFNGIVSFDVVYNGTVEVFETYGRRRLAATEALSAQMHGVIGVTQLSREQAAWLAPRAAELNQLATGIRARVTKDRTRARELVVELHKTLAEKLGLSFKIELKVSPKQGGQPA